VGRGRGLLQLVHAVSFGVWGVLMIIHVVAYPPRAIRLGTTDWRRHAERVVPGARVRRALLGGALLAGVIVALATYRAQQAFHPRAREPRAVAASGYSRIPAGLSSRWTLTLQTHAQPRGILKPP
jgi:hypothetical protein